MVLHWVRANPSTHTDWAENKKQLCQEGLGGARGQEDGHELTMSAHSQKSYPALHQNNSAGSRSRKVILPLYPALMRGSTGPSHKSMSPQTADRSAVQDSDKCSTSPGRCCSSLMHHICDSTQKANEFVRHYLPLLRPCWLSPITALFSMCKAHGRRLWRDFAAPSSN